MKALIAAVIIIAALLLIIPLLRVKTVLEYSEGEGSARVGLGPVMIALNGGKKEGKRKKARTGGGESEKKEKKKRSVAEDFKEKLSIILEIRDKIKRRLTVDELTLWYQSAADDPADAAMAFGAASAGSDILLPLIGRELKIKKQDVRIGVDFTARESRVYAKAALSLPVYVIIRAAAMLAKSSDKAAPNKKTEDG